MSVMSIILWTSSAFTFAFKQPASRIKTSKQRLVARRAEAAAPAPAPAVTGEALMDDKLRALGVSWYQALMAIFVAMVYAADGAEVTVMSLVAKTLAEKWKLESWKRGLLGMSVYSGMFSGGLICGPIADSRGRSFTLIAACALIAGFGVLSAYAPTFGLLCAARFIAGIGMGASLPVSSSLLQETVPAAWKGGLACLVFSGFNLGELFAAKAGVLAFGRPDPSTWLFLVAALPAVATLLVALVVPESPRFLAQRGNAPAVRRWFKRAAYVNRKKLENIFPTGMGNEVQALCVTKPKDEKPKNVLAEKVGGIFKPGGLRLKTLVLWAMWMSANSAFYGMIFSLPEALQFAKTAASDAAFDVAKGISKVSAYQSLAFLFFMPLVAMGVPYSVLFPFAFAGGFVAFLVALVGGTPSPATLVACLAAAKFFYNGIFMMLYPATGTAYPTALRATGTALAGTVGRICTILVAPVCTQLQLVAPLLPYKCFVVVSFVAFFTACLL